MENPRRFEKRLSSSSAYHMEVDLKKDDCKREGPHWHLCKNGRRIGQIFTNGYWASTPSESSSIIHEAEQLTSTYAYDIESTYNYNAENGAR